MADEPDVLLALYQEQVERQKHNEQQRATVSNLFIVINAALLGLITVDKEFTTTDLPIAVGLIFLGLIGTLLTLKYRERYNFHRSRGQALRRQLDELMPSLRIEETIRQADENHQSRSKVLFRLRQYWFWIGIHLVITALGVLLAWTIKWGH